LKQGVDHADGEELRQALMLWGPAVKAGDPAHISFVHIKDDHIHFEINGGPVHRKKWYQHIQVSGAGGTMQAPQDDPQANPHGSFRRRLLRQVCSGDDGATVARLAVPVLDFNARNKEQALSGYGASQVKEAIEGIMCW